MSIRGTTVLLGALFGCGSSGGGASSQTDGGTGSSGSGDPTSASMTAPTTTADTGTDGGNGGIYAECGGDIFVGGVLDEAEYELQARKWDREAIDCRLGPRWSDVHDAGEPDTRPDLWSPPTMMCGGDGTLSTYEYGPDGCAQDCAQ